MSLRLLQQCFQDYLLTENLAIENHISAPPLGDSRQRLEVYGHGYEARLEDTLTEDFSKLFILMGEEEFYQLTHAYISSHPSTHFSVSYYGEEFSEFLATAKSYRKKPWLREIAEFEWAQGMAIIAADSKLLTMEKLATVPQQQWPNLQFALHPSFQQFEFHYNILKIIEAIDNGSKLPRPRLLKSPQTVMVWRKQKDVLYSPISMAEATMLQALADNKNFAEICEILCDQMAETEVASFAVNQIGSWLSAHLLIDEK